MYRGTRKKPVHTQRSIRTRYTCQLYQKSKLRWYVVLLNREKNLIWPNKSQSERQPCSLYTSKNYSRPKNRAKWCCYFMFRCSFDEDMDGRDSAVRYPRELVADLCSVSSSSLSMFRGVNLFWKALRRSTKTLKQ